MPTDIKDILLVEDDPRDVELTLVALGERGLAGRVDVVHDGEQALDYLFRRGPFRDRDLRDPIVVLLDIKMPKIGGVEVLKVLKEDKRLKMIPVVMLTSSREDLDVVTCYQHGANAYVVKPVDFSEFVRAVQQLGIFWTTVNEPPPS